MVWNWSFGEPSHEYLSSQNYATPILHESTEKSDVSETNQLFPNTLYFCLNEGPRFAFRFSFHTIVL